MISYTVNFLYSTEGVGKKSGKPYYMANLLFTIFEEGVVKESYTANTFLTKEQFQQTVDYNPQQLLDIVFLPTSRGVQVISMDIAG